jgi:hypothetical protein
MSEMWERPQKPPSFSWKDMKAVMTLLVLKHHALLLEKTIEEFTEWGNN